MTPEDVIVSNNNESRLKIVESNGNFIVNVLVANIVGWGIHIVYSNSNNTIANPTLSNNRYGVALRSSSDNIIVNNAVTSNELGVSIYNSSNNLIYNNYFKT